MGGYRHIVLQSLDRCITHPMFDPQGVGRGLLPLIKAECTDRRQIFRLARQAGRTQKEDCQIILTFFFLHVAFWWLLGYLKCLERATIINGNFMRKYVCSTN